MSEKTERWAWARIRELEQQLRHMRSTVRYQRERAEHWKHRALRKKPVKR